jgi:mono/diheme cytochrome c family protein
MKRSLLVLLATITLSWSTYAHARAEEHRQGKEILQELCARCHSISRIGSSPNKRAPPFRSFSETKLYDSDFKQRLENGLVSIHPFMPTFRFSTEEAEEVLSYMRSIQERSRPK